MIMIIGPRDVLQAAKAKDIVLGNPNLEHAQQLGRAAQQQDADQRAGDLLPVIVEIQRSGTASLRQIANALTQRGIKTARGGEWTAMAVKNILDRAAA